MLEWNPSEIKIYKVKLWAVYFKQCFKTKNGTHW